MGSHTVRGGTHPRERRFCPRVFQVIYIYIEELLNPGLDPILIGQRWVYMRISSNQRSAGEGSASTLCGVVSTRRSSVFDPGLSRL